MRVVVHYNATATARIETLRAIEAAGGQGHGRRGSDEVERNPARRRCRIDSLRRASTFS
jgi:hypothetical protein